MEIERKYLIKREQLPDHLEAYPHRVIEQGYLCTDPVVRVRMDGDSYVLTYKSSGLMAREEYNLPLTGTAYAQLVSKTEGLLIRKTRYCIPLDDGLTIELDIFEKELAPLILAEVEFPDTASAESFTPPAWFGEDVTFSGDFHNSSLSRNGIKNIKDSL